MACHCAYMHRGTHTLTEAERAELQRRVARDGHVRTAEAMAVAPRTLARALTARPIRLGSAALVRMGMAMEPRP
jgi:hypothetical protein